MAKKISVLPPIEQDIAALTGVASGHDGLGLRQEDRVKCLKARNTMIVGGLTGLMLGLGVGSFLSFKLHRARKALLANFKAHSRPTHVVYGNGKYEAIHYTTSLRPLTTTNVLTYCLLIGGAAISFNVIGLASRRGASSRILNEGQESKRRIERAFRQLVIEELQQMTPADTGEVFEEEGFVEDTT